jgi:peptide/nickel transport system permease protein
MCQAILVILVLGLPLGLAAGYFRGWTDRGVGWLADLAFSIPAVVVVLVVLSVFPQSLTAAMITFAVLAAPGLMRVVRASTLAVREEAYIPAARISGVSHRHIISRHILPRTAGPLIVRVSLIAAVALLLQSGLSFLGLIVKAPEPSWGGMVADGASVLELQPWLIFPPGIAITVTVLALGLLGDAVRDTTTETWSEPARPRRRLRARGAPRRSMIPAQVADALLSVEHLSVTFGSAELPTRVVEDVSLDVVTGETVGIVGETGCGKTVTAMAILQLLPGTGAIEEGRIVFGGRDLCALSEREMGRIRGKEIGLISQEPMISLDPVFRTGAQIAEAVRQHHGCSRKAAYTRALELLRDVRLPDPEDVARRYPHELSGGMAQRVAIARALAGDPKLLIADEPTTALDVTVQAEILALLHSLKRERGLAILLVTHDWGVVADLCDRAFVMYAGQVVERGSVAAIFSRSSHPYTEALLASNPHIAVETARGSLPGAPGTTPPPLPAIPGMVPAPQDWPQGCRFHARCRYGTDECTPQPIPLLVAETEHLTRCIHHEQLAVSKVAPLQATACREAKS